MKTKPFSILWGYLPLVILNLFDIGMDYKIAIFHSVVSIIILLAVYFFRYPKNRYITSLCCSLLIIPFFVFVHYILPMNKAFWITPIVLELLLLIINLYLLFIRKSVIKNINNIFIRRINIVLQKDFADNLKVSVLVVPILVLHIFILFFHLIIYGYESLTGNYLSRSGLLFIGVCLIIQEVFLFSKNKILKYKFKLNSVRSCT